jgi:homoserine kinase type II
VDRFKDKNSHFVTKEKLREILGNYYSGDFSVKFEKVDSGYENINVIIWIRNKKYVLRIYNDKQYGRDLRDEKHLLYELNFLNYLAENKIPVAHINKTIDGKLFSITNLGNLKLFVVLFDFIPGNEIKTFNKEKIVDMAIWMAKIHKLSLDYKPKHIREKDGALNYYNWWLDAKKKGQEVRDPEIRAAYLPIIKYYQQYINSRTVKKFKTLQIHSDMHQGNLRFRNNKLAGIFDYDDTRHSIIPEDIGMFFHSILKRGDKKSCRIKIKTFFDAYESIRKLSNDEKRMSIFYALEKRYQGRYFEAYHDEKNDKMPPERRKYYLDYTKRFGLIKSLVENYSSDYRFNSLEDAKNADRIYCWLIDYLNGPGHNQKLAHIITETEGLTTMLTDAPLENLISVAGPNKTYKYPIDSKKWIKVTNDYAKKIESGWNPPPIIVTQGVFGPELSVADGNHRLEALKKCDIKRYEVILIKKTK